MPQLPGPRGPIAYERDALGYPTIRARDRIDGAFAHGWFIAVDRLVQVHLALAAARGKLLELAGESPLFRLLDRSTRALRLEHRAREEIGKIAQHTRAILDAWCAGFNAGAAKRGRPWVLRALGVPLEHAEPIMVLTLWRFYSYFGLTSQQQLAETVVAELMAGGAPARTFEFLLGDTARGIDLASAKELRLPKAGATLPPMGAGGSNAFAVAGSKSKTGGALLMGEFHLETARIPPVLYALSMIFEDGDYLLGLNLPGLFHVSAGRTRALSWSYTFAHGDNVDVLLERCERGRYRANGTWHPLSRREERVRIRGKKTPETWIFHDSDYGVIEGEVEDDGVYACTRWNAVHAGASDLDSAIELEGAESAAEGAELQRKLKVISLHAVLADAKGSIAYAQSGLVDRRPDGWSGAYPRRAWDLDARAIEPLPESSRPIIVDPQDRWIVSANEAIDGLDGARWATLPEPHYRAARLRALIDTPRKLDTTDLLRMSYDDVDLGARAMMEIWAPLLPNDAEVQALANWAREDASPRSANGALQLSRFHALHHETVRALLAPLLGAQRFARIFDELGMMISFQHHLDAALRLEKRALLDEAELRAALAIAWPIARRAPSNLPPATRFRNAFFAGKLPAFLGFDTETKTLPGGPLAPFQTRAIPVLGERLYFGPAFHLLIDMSAPGAWYNISGGASESRFGPGYAKGIDAWMRGVMMPLGPTVGPQPSFDS